MAPPSPNSAHGDQLISAKRRGTARFLSHFICDALEMERISNLCISELRSAPRRRPTADLKPWLIS